MIIIELIINELIYQLDKFLYELGLINNIIKTIFYKNSIKIMFILSFSLILLLTII